MISGQIVCFIAMHSLPYFYRQPLYRPGSRKASVSFAIFSAAVSAKFHVFYKNTAYKENVSPHIKKMPRRVSPQSEIKWFPPTGKIPLALQCGIFCPDGAKIMRAVKAHFLNREGPVFPI